MIKKYGYYDSPIGLIEICSVDNKIISLFFVDKLCKIQKSTVDVIDHCVKQLHEYFQKDLKNFNLFWSLQGTDFQLLVWNETIKIPYGKTITYKELAKRINKPKTVRAVGSAMKKNPLAILIPCHRVVRSDSNKIVNYYWGKERKIFLQKLENSL